MGLIQKTTASAKSLYDEVTLHWKKPSKGNYVSYKEMLNLGLGGMGQQMVLLLLGYMGLGATNTLLGSTLGVSPVHLQIMSTIQTILGIFITIIRSKIIDNTHTKIGKFRPYIAIMGIPLVAMTSIFIFLPFETFSYTVKIIAVFSFTLSLNICSPFFSETYNNLVSVITPKAEERTKVVTINTFLFSLAPTVTGLIVPLFAGLFQGTYTNINLYRYVIVPIALLGVGLNFFSAFGTKERVIESSSKPVKNIRIWKDAISVFKNKYWWILNIASVIGFTEGAFGIILSWVFIYGLQDMAAYSLVTAIMGTAATIGMAIAPIVLLKFGNKKVLLGHNICNIFLIIGMMLNYKSPMIFFVFYYLNTVINSLCLIYNTELYAEMKDYQQFIYRKRLDSTFAVTGLILTPISMLTGYFLPFVYESFGLTTNYNILYDPAVRNTLFYVICSLSVIGALLNLVPFFFFDMNAEKHKWVMNCIRLRAAVADKALGKNTPQQTKEICEILMDYDSLKNETFNISEAKNQYKKGKNERYHREELQHLKTNLKVCRRKVAEQKEIHLFTKELERFESEKMKKELIFSKKVTAFSREDFLTINDYELEKITDMLNKKAKSKFSKSVKKLHKYSIDEIYKMESCFNVFENGTAVSPEMRTLRLAKKYSKLFEFYQKSLDRCKEHDDMEVFFDIKDEYESACIIVAEEEQLLKDSHAEKALEKTANKKN